MCAALLFVATSLQPMRAAASRIRVMGQPQVIAEVEPKVLASVARIEAIFEGEFSDSILVKVVDSPEQFDSETRGHLPDWAAAVAIPPRTIVIKNPHTFRVGREFEPLIAHELTHIYLDQLAPHTDIPRWFHEGAAQATSALWDWPQSVALARASLTGRLFPLSRIESVNGWGEVAADVAYAQSFWAVVSLMREDRRFLPEMAHHLHAGEPFPAAFQAVTAEPLPVFYLRFYTSTRMKFRPWMLFEDWLLYLTGLGLVAIAAIALVRWRNRKRLARWAEEEAREDALRAEQVTPHPTRHHSIDGLYRAWTVTTSLDAPAPTPPSEDDAASAPDDDTTRS